MAAAALPVASAGCCAWPFEEPSSGYSSSRVVAMPPEVVRAGYRKDRALPPTVCQSACSQDACFPSAVVGRSGIESAVIVCNHYTERHCVDSGLLDFNVPSGRRAAPLGATPAEAFAALARAEHESVGDFARLGADLAMLGAPAGLRARARRARRDEIEHASTMLDLGALHGLGRPSPRVSVARRRARGRSLRSLAIENAVVGCVGETWGALLLALGERRAEDPRTRRALGRVARDEARHAALAFAIHAWLEPQLSPPDRRAVEIAVVRATERLVRRRPRIAPAVRRALGLPTAEEHAALAPGLAALVLAGLPGSRARSRARRACGACGALPLRAAQPPRMR